MRTRKVYPVLTRRTFRPEVTTCASCGARLRRRVTLSRRVVITQNGPLQVTHCGYRCPDAACPAPARTYRSAVADGLALPGFTFGLDWILVIGQLRLSQHLTLDQTHQIVQAQLSRWQVTISQREVLYLFEAYCSLLRAAQEWEANPPWRAEVEANGGLLLALDGIQPDKGHATIYLIRDLLTGHLLGAQNLLSSEAAVLQAVLLAPIAAWGLPVLGVLTDGQEALLQAVAVTWPGVPHQICHFQALREAGRLLYERDRAIKVQLRTMLQSRIRTVRRQLDRRGAAAGPEDVDEAPYARILADYAAGLQAVINRDGLQPFRFGAVALDDALGEVEQSLAHLANQGRNKGGAIPAWCANRRSRLRTIVRLRAPFAADLACLRRGQAWLLEAERLLSQEGDQPTQEQPFTRWRDHVARCARRAATALCPLSGAFRRRAHPHAAASVCLDRQGWLAAHQQCPGTLHPNASSGP
jgi:hypothetical protein